MTYWGLAKKYGTTVAQLRKWNGSEKVTMYPGKNGKYPVKLRVTQGMSTAALSKSLVKNKASTSAASTLSKIAKQLSK
jgi:LysM repeat protein